MARPIEALSGNGAPERLAGLLVVPNLRQAERDDEDIRSFEDLASIRANVLFIGGGGAVLVVPQGLVEFLLAVSPLKLLRDCGAIHHPLAASNHVGRGISAQIGDGVARLAKIGRDVVGEAATESSD